MEKATELESEIFDAVAKSYRVDVTSLSRDSTIEGLGKGSRKMIALLSLIENTLDVEIPLREGMKFQTLSEIVDRVASEL